MLAKNPWLVRASAPAHRFRLYCFPFAGGNAAAFQHWQDGLGPEIEVCAVQLPGRAARMLEPPMTSLSSVVSAVADAIARDPRCPFAFFGHSMGALLAFEVARHCMRTGQPLPSHLFASGCAAPQARGERRNLHRLPDAELIEALREYNGTPPELFAHRDLLDLVLPTIRADFRLVENYAYQASVALPIPLSVLAGRQDEHVDALQAQAWEKETTGPCRVDWFDGDHFFLQSQRAQVLAHLRAHCAPRLAA
jgi:medium-chain acyl-[acyl-carrier-protein] hydrolase